MNTSLKDISCKLADLALGPYLHRVDGHINRLDEDLIFARLRHGNVIDDLPWRALFFSNDSFLRRHYRKTVKGKAGTDERKTIAY